jgi:hypothetical protein
MAAEVIRNFPQLSITSAFRPGDPGYHGQGLARDLGGPVSVMNAAGRWMAERMTSMLLEGIHNPTLSVKNYKPVPSSFWGGGTWAGHADHIHMAAKESDGGPAVSFGGGPGNLRGIVDAVARAFGVGWATDLAMRRLNVESGFRADAVNRWDINWQRGTPSVGFAQIIGPTFAAYAGPYRNKGPFLYGVSLDPMAQIYTMFAYSIARYGRGGLARAWGGTQGYAAGGIVSEPVIGMGLRSGTAYSFAERGPELVSPLAGPGVYTPGGGGRTVINVYPQRGQDERAIAAAVSRELAWAAAGGAP